MLQVVCFDLSPSFILLGANSGTVYVLDHETLHLKKQIPAGVSQPVSCLVLIEHSRDNMLKTFLLALTISFS